MSLLALCSSVGAEQELRRATSIEDLQKGTAGVERVFPKFVDHDLKCCLVCSENIFASFVCTHCILGNMRID